tara:strand:+ start:4272 stop:4520 length:249 start_codon:yes stop_codon:yes gene_type:complete
MGRAIDTDKDIATLKAKVEKLDNIVRGVCISLDKVEDKVYGKETKKGKSKNEKKETNNKGNSKSSGKSNKGKADTTTQTSKS